MIHLTWDGYVFSLDVWTFVPALLVFIFCYRPGVIVKEVARPPTLEELLREVHNNWGPDIARMLRRRKLGIPLEPPPPKPPPPDPPKVDEHDENATAVWLWNPQTKKHEQQ